MESENKPGRSVEVELGADVYKQLEVYAKAAGRSVSEQAAFFCACGVHSVILKRKGSEQ